MKTVLIVGAGGREHALAHHLSLSPQVGQIVVAAGATQNQFWGHGFATEIQKKLIQLSAPLIPPFTELLAQLKPHEPELCVIGPDNALADGITDALLGQGYKVFGPTQKAAKIESSKGFAKELMKKAGVPTAHSFWAKSKEEALSFIHAQSMSSWAEGGGSGWVVKADGLALGKGVHVCDTQAQALEAVNVLWPLSQSLIIEEKLRGEEISWIALCDGSDFAILDPVRDHKRLLDQDLGPNTGGMGVYSPVPGLPKELGERVKREVFEPMLKTMKQEGVPFCGALFAGLMLDQSTQRLWVLEFNARFGDPETQVLMSRLDEDLYPWLFACSEGTLGTFKSKMQQERNSAQVKFKNEYGVLVVAAAPGYPDAPKKEQTLEFLNSNFQECHYYLAGAKKISNGWQSNGGRVLGVLGLGKTLETARIKAYQNLKSIKLDGMQARQDIALAPSIVVMGSGRGSNFDALVLAINEGRLHARIVGVFSDKQPEQGALIISKAQAFGIPTAVGQAFTNQGGVHKAIVQWNPKYIVLAGYMRILSPGFLKAFTSEGNADQATAARVINIHPSLLPAFPGMNSYKAAFEYGCKITGVTVHLVNEELDCGPILAQRSFEIWDCTQVQEVEARGLSIEHQLYAETLNWVLKEQFSLRRLAPVNHKERLRVCTS